MHISEIGDRVSFYAYQYTANINDKCTKSPSEMDIALYKWDGIGISCKGHLVGLKKSATYVGASQGSYFHWQFSTTSQGTAVALEY